MKNFPTTITAENFNDAANFVSTALAKTKKKSLIRKIVQPVGSILFLLLSLLLVYGAFFNFSDADDMIVFEKLSPLTKLWEEFSAIFTTADMEWYIYWPILIVAVFVLPLIVSAIITVIVSICYKKKSATIPEGCEAEKAKALNQSASEIRSQNRVSDSYKTIFSFIFILAFIALIVFAFITLKMDFSVSMIIGFVVVAAVLYFVYSLLFALFSSFNGNFYKTKNYGAIATATDAYWVSVDPEEAARRKAEEEKRAKEAELARIRAAENRALGEQKRIRALELERSGQYSLAKQLFKESAELGDALGMDNYARHCLINGNRSDAIYWLQKSIDTGEADDTSRALLRALKNGEHIDAHYN